MVELVLWFWKGNVLGVGMDEDAARSHALSLNAEVEVEETFPTLEALQAHMARLLESVEREGHPITVNLRSDCIEGFLTACSAEYLIEDAWNIAGYGGPEDGE